MSAEPPVERVWFVRHAEAGKRERWTGADSERPLNGEGRRQARRLLEVLRPFGVAQARGVMTSAYVRCRQTVEPLADELGLPVEENAALVEGAPLAATLRLIAARAQSVMSTHGDVMVNLLEHLGLLQRLPSGRGPWEKGCTWVLDVRDGEIVAAEYVAPPAG